MTLSKQQCINIKYFHLFNEYSMSAHDESIYSKNVNCIRFLFIQVPTGFLLQLNTPTQNNITSYNNYFTISVLFTGPLSIWSFCKQVGTQNLILTPDAPILDPVQLYRTVLNGWLGYLSLMDIDHQSLQRCFNNCGVIQGDG